MLGWRAQLRRASFRGVPFFTEEAAGESGRRWADHEYPGRDTPYAEDLGRAQRVWRFRGYLLGEACTIERDILVAACERAGPGELIHPTLGAVQAVCRTVTFTEERERGRAVTLEFEFAEAGQLQEPAAETDPDFGSTIAADNLGAVAPGQFIGGGFSVLGGGPWLAGAAVADVQSLAGRLSGLRLPAAGASQAPLVAALDYLGSAAPQLVANPADLTRATDVAFAAFTDAGEALPVTAAMLNLVGTTAPQAAGAPRLVGQIADYVPPTLPLARRRAANAAAWARFAAALALREIGYAAPGLDLDNYDEAIAMRDKIAAAFVAVEAEAAAAGDDESFAALAELRGAITRMIQARATHLTPLVTYRAAAVPNALGLAWRLYQDTSRDLDTAARLAARNPGFLPMIGRVPSAPAAGAVPAGGRL